MHTWKYSYIAKMTTEAQDECIICSMAYNKPVTLPCAHTFCEECINAWAASKKMSKEFEVKNSEEHTDDVNSELIKEESETKVKVLSCPTCRELCKILEDGVGGFINISSFSIKDVEANVEGATGISEASQLTANPLCDWCLDISGACKCRECDIWLCLSCRDTHNTIKTKRSHSLFTAEEISEGACREDYKKCSRHQSRPVEMFCVICKELCCLMGAVTLHQGHKCMTLVDKLEKSFSVMMKQLKNAHNSAKVRKTLWTKSDDKVDEQAEAILQEIDERNNLLVSFINEETRKQKQQVSDAVKCYKESSIKTKQELDNILDNINKLDENILQIQKTMTPIEIYGEEQNHQKAVDEILATEDQVTCPIWKEFSLSDRKALPNHAIMEFLGTLKGSTESTIAGPYGNFIAKTASDHKNCSLWDICFLSDGNIAVCDDNRGNTKVMVFQKDGKEINESREGELSDPSWLMEIPGKKNEILVSEYDNNSMISWNIELNEVSQLLQKDKVPLSEPCGVSVTIHNGEIAIVVANLNPPALHLFGPNTWSPLAMYSLNDPHPSFVSGNKTHNCIAVSCGYWMCKIKTESEIYVAVYQNGHKVWSVGSSVVSYPFGVYMTTKKQVLVCNFKPASVVLLSETGQLLCSVVKEDLESCIGLDYDEDSQILAIAEESGAVKLFKCWI